MGLLDRKRLRKLRFALYGKPQLVTPVPVIGGHRALAKQDLSDEFIFGSSLPIRRGIQGGPFPSDQEWAEQYKAFLTDHVTYNPSTARDRLMGLLTNDFGEPITTLTIEHFQGEHE